LLRATANRRTQLLWVAQSISAILLAFDGRAGDVSAHVAAASRRLGSPPPPIIAHRLVALQANALRSSGSPERALRIMAVEPLGVPALAFERVAAYLTVGRVDEALKEFDVWPTPDDPARNPLAMVERLTMQAWVASSRGRTADADQFLDDALEWAEPHCLVEVFARAGGPVIDLLAERSDARSGFTQRTLNRARAVRAPGTPKALADPLTKRELAILSYLPTRLRNAEIADRCYLSLNTVKTHLARIYRKLGVANRNEAIMRAREFGLIDASKRPD
jgi:LuxR family transcriptional regulator, maltose regulon positive regulatory protein